MSENILYLCKRTNVRNCQLESWLSVSRRLRRVCLSIRKYAEECDYYGREALHIYVEASVFFAPVCHKPSGKERLDYECHD